MNGDELTAVIVAAHRLRRAAIRPPVAPDARSAGWRLAGDIGVDHVGMRWADRSSAWMLVARRDG
jgi:hypothetical protein